jgi:hypothetical protein
VKPDRGQSHVLGSSCVCVRVKSEDGFVRETRDAGALQKRLTRILAGIAGRLRQSSPGIRARTRLDRRFLA